LRFGSLFNFINDIQEHYLDTLSSQSIYFAVNINWNHTDILQLSIL